MALRKTQIEIDGLVDPRAAAAEQEKEDDAQRLLFEHLLAECRLVARTLTYEHCAVELDRIWAKNGRGVSPSTLRAALNGTERNYFRLEWAIWFARQSDGVAELLAEIAGRGKPQKKPEDELRDLKELMRRKLGSVANELIRKAETS